MTIETIRADIERCSRAAEEMLEAYGHNASAACLKLMELRYPNAKPTTELTASTLISTAQLLYRLDEEGPTHHRREGH